MLVRRQAPAFESLLEWPTQASAQPNSDGELTSALPEKPGNPLDSQAWAPMTRILLKRGGVLSNDALGAGFAGIVGNGGIASLERGDVRGNYQHCGARKRLKVP